MSDQQDAQFGDDESPFLLSHLVHTLRAYLPVITLGAAVVAVAYVIVALVVYLGAPSRRVTTQPFRLEFQGASVGTYPNGVKFNSAEIVASPVLLKVFADNHLSTFTTFDNFSHSMFILEANPEYERLAADYEARLADPRLSPVDRERIEKEWDAKRASINKSDYSVNYIRSNRDGIPESLIRKSLIDVLNTWAGYATREQHVMEYRLAMLSPDFVTDGASRNVDDPVRAILLLRSKVVQVLNEIDDLLVVPGAELVRTQREGLSLAEIRARFDELLRFRLEPMIGLAHASGIIRNPSATIQYLQTQLAYDQRRLKLLQDRADAEKQAMVVYTLSQDVRPSTAAGRSTVDRSSAASSETVMPQLSDTFIDRLIALTSQSGDIQYRQKLVDDYRKAMAYVIPAEQDVAFDEQTLSMMRSATGPTSAISASDIRAQIESTQADARQLVTSVNEIYEIVSRNLNPSTELYAVTAPPIVRTDRSTNPRNLILYGVVTMLVALLFIVGLCLIHNRVREEDAVLHAHETLPGSAAQRATG